MLSSTSSYSLMTLTTLPESGSYSESESVTIAPIENPVSVPSSTFSHVSSAPREMYVLTNTPLYNLSVSES